MFEPRLLNSVKPPCTVASSTITSTLAATVKLEGQLRSSKPKDVMEMCNCVNVKQGVA